MVAARDLNFKNPNKSEDDNGLTRFTTNKQKYW